MSTRPIVPCLWFDDQAQQAAALYTRIFPNGHVIAVSHYPQVGDNPSHKAPGSILTVELEIAGQRFSALNGGPQFKINPSISFFVGVPTVEQTERLVGELLDGGRALMKLDKYPWSERYAWVQDRFGVSWQVLTGKPGASDASVAPCLLFAGAQQGRARQAVDFYTRIFPASSAGNLKSYGAEEGNPAHVKHGVFTLAGQELVIMDGGQQAENSFNEGVSLQVMCEDQAELDRYWSALSEGGQQQQCGWLKDRFGVSWQVVPKSISAWMSSSDVTGRDRAFKAMMQMKKPDVAALQSAFEGR